jgi:hypothetical protein
VTSQYDEDNGRNAEEGKPCHPSLVPNGGRQLYLSLFFPEIQFFIHYHTNDQN